MKYKNLADPPEFEDFAMDDVNVREDSDLTLRVGPNPDDMHTIHLHKSIMAAHSAVVAGMLSTQRCVAAE